MKGYIEFPLLDMIEQLGEEKVKRILSDFSCPRNKDVEYFLKHRAIEFSKQQITQTQLVFLQYKDAPRLVAYYSLTNKSISVKDDGLSKTLRKRIAKFGTRDTVNKGFFLPAPLIAQLGKSFTDGLNQQISGDELLKMAINKIVQAQTILGGKVVYIECEDAPRLLEFYSRNGFIQFGKREKESEDEGRIVGDYLLQLLKVINK
ncbi:N-acetyltransferase [Paenibacillus peoriae]|uniref:N-acetyltransferase n=1 Tax=Paenibacillus peoriae TaxID=59893 RepID=UPI000CEC537A|nr:N-acetyltransferase [Paenibacillus peoriae]PPQ49142.1 N-acetyltransferase [Paenibacillus peoriae]